ncbi:MAG: O-antigen ligase family protein [Candidatus Gorgyraea atricola]|nr:O-antigen ligase family protein [Candidatus Gorgyraea atricola]
MSLKLLFTPETIILLGVVFTGMIFLFLLVNKNFVMGIYLWFLIDLFLKYQKLNFAGSIMPAISMERILFAFLIGIFIIEVFSGKLKISRFTGIEYVMLLFCLFALISMFWTGSLIRAGGKLNIGQLLTGYIFPFSMFFISKNVYDNAKKREGFIKFVMLIGLYLVCTAFLEHFHINRLIWPRYILDPSFGIHFERARGPFVQGAVNGTVLGFVLVSSFYFLLHRNKRDLWRTCSRVLLILSPIAIFFTYTRAAWVGALAGFSLILLFILKQGKKMSTLVIIILCIGIFIGLGFFLDDSVVSLSSERAFDESPVHDRLNLYIAMINMFKEHPILGVGFGKFTEFSKNYFKNVDGIHFQAVGLSGHDSFAGVLAEMGILGFSLIASVYLLILRSSIRLYKNLKKDAKDTQLVIVFWAFMIVFIVNSVFIEMKFFEFVSSMFFVFAGIICAWERNYAAARA